MEKEYQVLEGKTFTIDLLSYAGSTNYAWCVSELPKEIVLVGMENVQARGTNDAITIQRFYLGAVSAEESQVEITFTMHCLSEISQISETYTAKVTIIPHNEFVSFSENDVTKYISAYAFPNTGKSGNPGIFPCSPISPIPAMDYGYPYNVQDANLIYGYSCGVQDANMKYGYPCGVQDANMKYGYPCGVQDANMKYGYPCGVQDTNMKYGYPCGVYAKDMRPYGVPYWE